MDRLIFILTQKVAVFFIASLTALGGFLSLTPSKNPGLQTAFIAQTINVPSDQSLSFVSTTFSLNLPEIPPGLLSVSSTPFCAPSSTCATKALRARIAAFDKMNAKLSIVIPTTSSTSSTTHSLIIQKIITSPTASISTTPTTIAKMNMAPISAQEILANITTKFHEQHEGPFEVLFSAGNSGGENLTWDLSATSIGGTGTIPKYSFSYSCDPVPLPADPGAPDQNPSFQPKTTYTCTLSLTPYSGTDLQTQSKQISFTTPSGQLFVVPAIGMDTLLTNDANNSGIVFDNKDNSPVTVTSVTFDVAYNNMNNVGQPLILRILDPATNASLFDYHLENTSNAPSQNSSISKNGISIPLSFVVPASKQKMLPIEILGVQKMIIPGTTPTISISLRNITTNREDVRTNLNNVIISWSCSIPIAGYDPNATSGPFFAGNACRN